jgi:thiol-disulfide isomerase/thioredoxin
MAVGPVNTPHNGNSPRPRWPEPIRVPVSRIGEFTLTGLSPAEYYAVITAPGCAEQNALLNFEHGKVPPGREFRLYRDDLGYYIGSKAPKPAELSWENDLQKATKRAQDEQKPLLVMMTASWCGPCNQLEQDTLNDPWIRHFLSGFVLLKANEDKEVEKIYISNGYPTLVFADRGGKTVHRVVGYQSKLPFAKECAKALVQMQLPVPPELEKLAKVK